MSTSAKGLWTTRRAPWLLLTLGLVLWLAPPVLAQTIGQVRSQIQRTALDPLGVPYVWGGTNPSKGLDCSGFVLGVYRKAGLDLPRTSNEQFRFTQYLGPTQPQRGDLVFFNMKLKGDRPVDHVGIYLGRGYFAHASFSRGIIVDNLNTNYYRQHLRGIRRHPALAGK